MIRLEPGHYHWQFAGTPALSNKDLTRSWFSRMADAILSSEHSVWAVWSPSLILSDSSELRCGPVRPAKLLSTVESEFSPALPKATGASVKRTDFSSIPTYRSDPKEPTHWATWEVWLRDPLVWENWPQGSDWILDEARITAPTTPDPGPGGWMSQTARTVARSAVAPIAAAAEAATNAARSAAASATKPLLTLGIGWLVMGIGTAGLAAVLLLRRR